MMLAGIPERTVGGIGKVELCCGHPNGSALKHLPSQIQSLQPRQKHIQDRHCSLNVHI